MRPILAVAENTFREAVRDRVLYLILFFALLVISASEAVAVLAVGAAEKVVLDLGLAAISLFGVLVSLFLGLALVAKEIDRRTIYTVVSKPISRGQFLAGKFCGLFAVVVLVVAGMTAFFLGFARLRFGVGGAHLLAPVALSLVEDWLIAAFAVLFSSFTRPILGTLFTITVWVVGHLSAGLKLLAAMPAVAGSAAAKPLLALYYLLPNLERLNVRDATVHGEALSTGSLLAAAAYGVGYGLAVLLAAAAALERRSFT